MYRQERDVTAQEPKGLQEDRLREIYSTYGEEKVVALVQAGVVQDISLTLLELPKLDELFANSDAFMRLAKEAAHVHRDGYTITSSRVNVDCSDLFKLEESVRTKIYSNLELVLTLIKEGHVSIEDLSALSAMNDEVISHLSHQACLSALREGKTTLDKLSNMTAINKFTDGLDQYPPRLFKRHPKFVEGPAKIDKFPKQEHLPPEVIEGLIAGGYPVNQAAAKQHEVSTTMAEKIYRVGGSPLHQRRDEDNYIATNETPRLRPSTPEQEPKSDPVEIPDGANAYGKPSQAQLWELLLAKSTNGSPAMKDASAWRTEVTIMKRNYVCPQNSGDESAGVAFKSNTP